MQRDEMKCDSNMQLIVCVYKQCYTSTRYSTLYMIYACVCGVDICNSRQRTGKDQRRVRSVVDTRESNARQVDLAPSHNWVRATVC